MTKTLIRGGTIVSMDPKIGDLPQGDVLIDGERIAALARAAPGSRRCTHVRPRCSAARPAMCTAASAHCAPMFP